MKAIGRFPGIIIALVAISGCSTLPESSPIDTGAQSTTKAFFESILRRDWISGFELLHPDVRKNWTLSDYTKRAQTYLTHLGFDPTAVHIRTCEEQGSKATARIDLSGAGPNRHHYKDGISLQTFDGKWYIIPNRGFGK